MSDAGKRTGILGGTFDPIHFGHLRVAVEVKEKMDLDRIIFIPAGVPPHKIRPDLASATDRLEMTRLACEGRGFFEVSDIELRRHGPSYTVDTLSSIAGDTDMDGELFFIMGMDAFFQFHTWKNPGKILSLVSLIVMTRPGTHGEDLENSFFSYAAQNLDPGYHACRDNGFKLIHEFMGSVHFISVTGLEISGTEIRRLAGAGRILSFLVPEKVEKYINDRGLYR